MKTHALKSHAPDRRRSPRAPRVLDPLLEAAAIALLILLAFWLLA